MSGIIVSLSDPGSIGVLGEDGSSKSGSLSFLPKNLYIIIGTICLVLAIAVVVAAYFVIKNMK